MHNLLHNTIPCCLNRASLNTTLGREHLTHAYIYIYINICRTVGRTVEEASITTCLDCDDIILKEKNGLSEKVLLV